MFRSFKNSVGRTLGRFLAYILIGILLILLFGKGVHADVLADYSTNYYYRRSNSSTSYTTGFRPNSSVTINKVVSNGSLNNDYFSYITGFNNKINANFSKGIEYFIKTEFVMTDVESYSYVSDSSNPQYGYGFRFHDYVSRIKSNAKTTTTGVNLLDTSVILKTSNCYEGFDDSEFCTFHIFVTFRIYVNNDISQLEIGSYTTSDVSFGVWKHLYNNDVSISSIEYVANVDGKIIEQQQQINDSITSDDNDFTSKKCGIICKLKNLPGQIINGLLDGLKNLFVPSDGYFSDWFDDISTFFNNKLGFLVYPFTFIVDILNRYLDLNDTGSYVISIPNITVPFFDLNIINATSYDLADLLDNSILANAHSIWFAFLNFATLLSFIALCLKKYTSIFGGDSGGDYQYFTEEEGHEYDIKTGEVTRSWIKSKKSERKKKE